MDSLRGQLLVAAPTLQDPNFLRTVVLVGEHTEEGALGVVLNRPSELTVQEAVPDLVDLVEEGDIVHVGGPVQPAAVLVLVQYADPLEGRQLVLGDVGFLPVDSDEEDPVEAVGAGVRRARVFAGYAGWGPGQLESELEREDWIITPGFGDDVFTGDPDALWRRVLERKGGAYRLVARMPVDPSVN